MPKNNVLWIRNKYFYKRMYSNNLSINLYKIVSNKMSFDRHKTTYNREIM